MLSNTHDGSSTAVAEDLQAGRANVELSGHPTPAGRELLGAYKNYAEAQAVVDRLSDAEFPVEHTSIIVRDLAFVEQVTGRLTWGKVIARGFFSGLMIGLFVGLFFGLFLIDPFDWMTNLLFSGAVGAAIGVLFALIAYWSSGGKRDFDSVGAMTGGSYDVYVTAEYAEKARQLIA